MPPVDGLESYGNILTRGATVPGRCLPPEPDGGHPGGIIIIARAPSIPAGPRGAVELGMDGWRGWRWWNTRVDRVE